MAHKKPNLLKEYFFSESHTLIKDLKKIINSNNTSNHSALQDVFQEIPDSLICGCLNAVLENFQTDILYEYSYLSKRHITLYSDRDFSLSIRPITSADEILSIEPMHCFYKILNNGTLNYKKFAVDQDIQNDEFSLKPRLKMVDKGKLVFGEIQTKIGNKEAILFSPISQKTELLLILQSSPAAPFQWLFDNKNLAPVEIYDMDVMASHMIFLQNILSILGDEESVEFLVKTSQHPQFNIRWNALENIAVIDNSAAEKLTKEFIKDPHYMIRAAAKTTLDSNP